jgi:hypothetical protein
MRNWKTTACGAVIAVVMAIEAYNGHSWQGYLGAAAVAALGYFAKDFNAEK